MDGGHAAAENLEIVVNDFGDGREAIGGARGVGNDVVPGGIVNVVVDSEDEGDIFILGGCGDDDFFDASAKVLPGVVGVGESSGGVENDLGADGFPRQRGGV